MNTEMALPYQLFKQRRETLKHLVFSKEIFEEEGLIVLAADFEKTRYVFRQESSFYYFTGVTEPGALLFMYSDGRDVLYLPNYGGRREQWVITTIQPSKESAQKFHFDEIKQLGAQCNGYSISPLFQKKEYEHALNDLHTFILNDSNRVFMLLDKSKSPNILQLQYYQFFITAYPGLVSRIKDCAPFADELRTTKDKYELDCMYRAAQITAQAHKAAAGIITAGKYEYEVQALIESVFTMFQASGPAFPSIVATGFNTTVLHYTERNQELKAGDLVVVDIGADYQYYAADITRTYPVDGRFSPRQREIYSLVLQTQQHIESLAAPGMFLNNAKQPEKSLHHRAIAFLKERGYERYFVHGIGHFLGIDVHDVGDVTRPLQAGDVITIEPGIYIRDENLGVRIEDDYVLVDDGCFCLSDDLPKTPEEIEALMLTARNNLLQG